MNALQLTHTVLAWVVVFANGGVGAWCLLALARPAVNSAALWVSVAVAYSLVFAQIAVGVAVLANLGTPAPNFHVFYGVCAALAVAVLYGYRHQLGRQRHLMFGLGSLFIMGLAIRAMFLT